MLNTHSHMHPSIHPCSFHAAVTLRAALAREWTSLPPSQHAAMRAYLMEYVLHGQHAGAEMQVCVGEELSEVSWVRPHRLGSAAVAVSVCVCKS